MPTYKVTYFEAKGRAELMRLVLAAAGVEYTDERMKKDEWAKLKPKTPLGQMPLLTVDGVMYPQSTSGARYIAGQTRLAGKTDLEKFQADVLVDTIGDLMNTCYKAMFEGDEAKKAKLLTDFKTVYAPGVLKALEKFLESYGKNSGYFVGNALTWADLSVFDWYDKHLNVDPDAYKAFPKLAAHKKLIESLPKVKAWLAKRPQTDM